MALEPSPGWGEDKQSWPSRPDQLEVTLVVVHALADGPVVCKVVLKNVSSRTLDYGWDAFEPGPFLCVDAAWKRKKELLFRPNILDGWIGLPYRQLKPAETDSKVFYIHKDYLAIPAGKCTVRFGWNVYRRGKNGGQELLFVLKRSQEVEILPATDGNLAAVLSRLQRQYAELAGKMRREDDYHCSSSDESESFVNTLGGSWHEAFVPLLVQAIDSWPGKASKGKLLQTIYESHPSPRGGFSILADYLASPLPASAGDVFEYWKDHDKAHQKSAERQQELKKKPNPSQAGATTGSEQIKWEFTLSEEEAWKTSRRHLDTRLTEYEFARLRLIPNVWVRVLLYSYYPEHCPAPWREALLNDLKKSLDEPPGLRKLMKQLDDPQFQVRERAARELSQLGPVWVPLFQDLADKSSSAEAARRLRMIADKLDDPVLFRLERRTIAHLVRDLHRQNEAMLKILLDAKDPNKVTQTAKEALAEKKRDEE